MYFPYLRGKQFELILLRENAELLAEKQIHPIIELVKENFTSILKATKSMAEHKVEFTLIVNPQAATQNIEESKIVSELIDGDKIDPAIMSVGYLMHPNSLISDLVKLLKRYPKLSFSIIHQGFNDGKKLGVALCGFENIRRHIFIDGFGGKLYQKHIKNKGVENVLIRDGFKPQKKNSDYPLNDHFSDLHITYPEENMDGFGDYLIVGSDYSETGGPAYAVAIHITYLGAEDDMFIYHFVSDQTDSPTDPGGKFLEALTKLGGEINKPNTLIYNSKACREFLDMLKNRHYPGLGYVKKLSMQHHIELIAHFLK